VMGERRFRSRVEGGNRRSGSGGGDHGDGFMVEKIGEIPPYSAS
jgi:hypothetical protein